MTIKRTGNNFKRQEATPGHSYVIILAAFFLPVMGELRGPVIFGLEIFLIRFVTKRAATTCFRRAGSVDPFSKGRFSLRCTGCLTVRKGRQGKQQVQYINLNKTLNEYAFCLFCLLVGGGGGVFCFVFCCVCVWGGGGGGGLRRLLFLFCFSVIVVVLLVCFAFLLGPFYFLISSGDWIDFPFSQ